MDFFIKKGSTHPKLILELIKSNFTDSDTFFEDLANSQIKFSMKHENRGYYTVLNSDAEFLPDMDNPGEYFIAYTFKKKDVDDVGTFIGSFEITFNTGGNLIIPIKEDLRIHVI